MDTLTGATLKRVGATNEKPSHLRTQEMTGFFGREPTPGERFTLFGESLEAEDGVRILRTSPVKSVEVTATGFNFETENSRYELSVTAP